MTLLLCLLPILIGLAYGNPVLDNDKKTIQMPSKGILVPTLESKMSRRFNHGGKFGGFNMRPNELPFFGFDDFDWNDIFGSQSGIFGQGRRPRPIGQRKPHHGHKRPKGSRSHEKPQKPHHHRPPFGRPPKHSSSNSRSSSSSSESHSHECKCKTDATVEPTTVETTFEPTSEEPTFETTTEEPTFETTTGEPTLETTTEEPTIETTPGNISDPTFNTCDMCGLANPASPIKPNGVHSIVGGEDANPHSLRWQAQLQVGDYLCGGTLISCNWVLSAAHCFEKSVLQDVYNKVHVLLGTDQLRGQDGVQCRATEVIIGDKWGKDSTNDMVDDIALVKIECDQDINNNENIIPACLPTADVDYHTQGGASVLISGWGTTSQDGSVSQTLQQVYLNTIAHTSCAESYSPYNSLGLVINDKMMCAAAANMDSCQGDSGGPVMVEINSKWTVVGIVSFGIGCANEKFPGVYTHVSSYLDFIHSHTGI